MTLHAQYQELCRSASYAFSSKGQVCACLYGRVTAQDSAGRCSTVQIKLTRIITGTSSGVGYSYSSAQATLSGSLTYTWNGGASGMKYVGEHTVFEQTFSVYHAADGSMSLSLAAVYDDSYITALSLPSVTCDLPTLAPQKPATPTVTSVAWNTAHPTRHSAVTLTWTDTGADWYYVYICRKIGDYGEVVSVVEPRSTSVTLELGGLDLHTGEEMYFMVQSIKGGIGSDNAFTAYYLLRPTLWRKDGDWGRGVPWVRVGGAWRPARQVYVRVAGSWRKLS